MVLFIKAKKKLQESKYLSVKKKVVKKMWNILMMEYFGYTKNGLDLNLST